MARVIEKTLIDIFYKEFISEWQTLSFKQIFFGGPYAFEKKTNKAFDKKSLTDILFKYSFAEGRVKTRFHFDIGFKPKFFLNYPAVIYIVYSNLERGILCSYAGSISPNDLGFHPINRKNYKALVKIKCNELSDMYKVPVIMKFVMDPPRGDNEY